MENKYYTPEIEEFCIGFEFEMKLSQQYEKHIFNQFEERSYRFIYDLIQIEKQIVRVKYLDRHDIEECGWKFIKQHAGTETFEFELGKFGMTVNFNFRGKIHVRIGDNDETYENEITFFHGTIRNKSELKKIMVQLNVNPKTP